MPAQEPLFDMHSNTQRQYEAYRFASQPGYMRANDATRRILTISGLTARDGAQEALETAFGQHFAARDMQVTITPNANPALPVHFHVTLTGNAYGDVMAGEAAEHEIEASGRKPQFLRDVMLRSAYSTINQPQFTLDEQPGNQAVVITGPVHARSGHSFGSLLTDRFGSDGLSVTYTPQENPQHFTARFTGTAYENFKAAQAAHEAANPVAIGH